MMMLWAIVVKTSGRYAAGSKTCPAAAAAAAAAVAAAISRKSFFLQSTSRRP